MTVLVIGGSGSGKSAYAEKTALELSAGRPHYYFAAMHAYGAEGEVRVKRHRQLRAGKGFVTVEQYTDIDRGLEQIAAADRAAYGNGTVLLECVSNLTANEMFDHADTEMTGDPAEKICRDIASLAAQTENLVIVSNNVADDGICYPGQTRRYIEVLNRVNADLAARADRVVEVVCSIPVIHKERPYGGAKCPF